MSSIWEKPSKKMTMLKRGLNRKSVRVTKGRNGLWMTRQRSVLKNKLIRMWHNLWCQSFCIYRTCSVFHLRNLCSVLFFSKSVFYWWPESVFFSFFHAFNYWFPHWYQGCHEFEYEYEYKVININHLFYSRILTLCCKSLAYLNSLTPGRSGFHFKNEIFNFTLLIGIFRSFYDDATS